MPFVPDTAQSSGRFVPDQSAGTSTAPPAAPEKKKTSVPPTPPFSFSNIAGLASNIGQIANPMGAMLRAGQAANKIGGAVEAPFEKMGQAAQEKIQKTSHGPIQDIAGYAAKAGIEAIPLAASFAGPAAGEQIAKKGGTLAKWLMRSALKPTVSQEMSGKAETAVQTLLDQGINVTHGGAEKLQGRIDKLNQNIAQRIASSPATIDKEKVADRLFPLIEKFTKQVSPMTDIRAIEKAWQEFMDHPLLTGKDIPVQAAQEMKKGTYKMLGDKAYTGELKSAEIEAQKALARGLKEEIAAAVPKIGSLNAEESKLLTTLPMVERRALMNAHRNPVGLGFLTLNPAHLAAWLADRSSLFKSLVARMINRGSSYASAIPKSALPIGASATGQGLGQQIQPPPQ